MTTPLMRLEFKPTSRQGDRVASELRRKVYIDVTAPPQQQAEPAKAIVSLSTASLMSAGGEVGCGVRLENAGAAAATPKRRADPVARPEFRFA